MLGLLFASDELLLEELFEYIQDYMLKEYHGWIKQNLVLVSNAAFKLSSKKLQDYCIDSICANPQSFITSKNFPSLDKGILFLLLENVELVIKEIEIWNGLIKWGIEQTPGLGSMNDNINKWNQEDFEALKTTLSQFIPLIRFMEITRAEFYDKVRPYKDIIPKNIYEEIKEFYYKNTLPKSITLLPLRRASTIIKPQLITILANWIDGKDSNVLSYNNNYRFDLIYLKSRDGFDCMSFNNQCKEQGPFVALVRVDSKKIYGGYNSVGYALRGGSWLSSSTSFIFSFENDQDIITMKIGRVNHENKCIYENYHCIFFNFGSQLIVNRYGSGCDLHLNNIYDGFVDIFKCSNKLSIEEIEVLGVVKK
ncbi:5945_t:CDS:1 [Funneliformis geosporum]|nr:5945_t:CDS:1 [Funneliformis geosporum]